MKQNLILLFALLGSLAFGQQKASTNETYDLVILNGRVMDPETITDHATFKVGENGLPTTGIPYVIINGVIAVKDSKVLPLKVGQEIRFPVEAKGRFTPVEKEKWMMEHTIGVNPGLSKIHVDDDSGAGALLKKKYE
jgi:N-acyl-D-glutamate deacylase